MITSLQSSPSAQRVQELSSSNASLLAKNEALTKTIGVLSTTTSRKDAVKLKGSALKSYGDISKEDQDTWQDGLSSTTQTRQKIDTPSEMEYMLLYQYYTETSPAGISKLSILFRRHSLIKTTANTLANFHTWMNEQTPTLPFFFFPCLLRALLAIVKNLVQSVRYEVHE